MSPPKLPELFEVRRVRLRHAMPGSLTLTSRLPYLPPLPSLPLSLTSSCKCGIVTIHTGCTLHGHLAESPDACGIMEYLEKEGPLKSPVFSAYLTQDIETSFTITDSLSSSAIHQRHII